MNLKDGDIVTIDGIQMVVTHSSDDGCWFQERSDITHYYSLIYHTTEALIKLFAEGRLVRGTLAPVTPGKTVCAYHTWQKYVGATETYDYCSRCDAKRVRDWRNIRDGKEF